MVRLNTQAIARVGAKPTLPALRVESPPDFAISIGAAFEAHIAGIAFAFDPVVTPSVLDGLSSTWVDVQRDESRAAAKAAIDRFETAAKLFETSLATPSARSAGSPASMSVVKQSYAADNAVRW
jgi:hypothetical protein